MAAKSIESPTPNKFSAATREILLLGNPLLLQKCDEVHREELDALHSIIADLHDTLMDFRARYGAGRAIAAPQIGVMKRLVYMHISIPVVFVNPVLDQFSAEKFELWDDCMSFPDLFVRVSRRRRRRIRYRDVEWVEREMELASDLSELLQHETDHLDGILAVSRAIDGASFALRSQRRFISE
ncbi:MAG: peptide deformylase [Candidatus Zixiibacteriota bacterium]